MTERFVPVIASAENQMLAIANASNLIPTQPEGLNASEVNAIVQEADNMIGLLKDKSAGLTTVAKVGNIGTDVQLELAGKSQLLQARLKPLFEKTGAKQDVDLYKGLENLRREADSINPALMEQRGRGGWVKAVLSLVPGMNRVLTDIAVRFDNAQEVIDAIVSGLLGGKQALLADNTELASLSDQVDSWIMLIQSKAYLSELVFVRLREAPDSDLSLRSREAKTAILERIVTRVQDLRTMEVMFRMLATTLQATFNGNNDLSDTIDRAATITRGLLMVGLSNAVALARQKRTIKVVQQNKESNERLLQAVAEAAGMGAVEIAKLLNDPAISIKAMQGAHDTLIKYLDQAQALKANRLQRATEALPQLAVMSESLDRRLEGLRAVAERPENQN